MRFLLGSAEDSVLGNVILPGYKIEPVAKEDKIRRRFAFKVGCDMGGLNCLLYCMMGIFV